MLKIKKTDQIVTSFVSMFEFSKIFVDHLNRTEE